MVPSPFSGATFLGSCVRSFSSSIGWNGASPSQLTVQLVDDPLTGARFSPPPVGSPAHFSFHGFNFSGLFQKWESRRDEGGSPTFEAVLADPREILDGAQVVLGNYSGPVGGVRNLFNAFGYWESTGHGNSLANDSGMPWYRVRDAVLALCNAPSFGAFGGPLSFRGRSYGLDLSQLPSPPAYYRVGGGAAAACSN